MKNQISDPENELVVLALLDEAVNVIECTEINKEHLSDKQWKSIRDNREIEVPYHAFACPACREKLARIRKIPSRDKLVSDSLLKKSKRELLSLVRREQSLDRIRSFFEKIKNTTLDMFIESLSLDLALEPLRSSSIKSVSQAPSYRLIIDVVNLTEFDLDQSRLRLSLPQNILHLAGIPAKFLHSQIYLTLLPFEKLQKRYKDITRDNSEEFLTRTLQEDGALDIVDPALIIGGTLDQHPEELIFKAELSPRVLKLLQCSEEILTVLFILP